MGLYGGGSCYGFIARNIEQKLLSIDDAADMTAGQVGQLVPMDEKASKQSRQLMKKAIKQNGK